MGEALIAGLVTAGWNESDIAVAEPVDARRAELAARWPRLTVVANPVAAEGALIAVKPADVESACAGLESSRVLSIAAGVTIANLESWLDPGVAVVRAMPNTPAQVGAGAAAIAAGSAATAADLDWAEGILSAVGIVVRVPEDLLDAVTGLSGSGPAYLFLVTEALIRAGVAAGLPDDVSHKLAIQTVVGSARLLDQPGSDPAALRAAVITPGGTTEAGLEVLNERGLEDAFRDAVAAATRRSRELAGN